MLFRITCNRAGRFTTDRTRSANVDWKERGFPERADGDLSVARRQRRCHRQAKAPSGSSCEGSGDLHPRRPKKQRFVTTITQKTAVCDDHHLQKGGKERMSTKATSFR
jgi:hypothetical protein